MEEQQDGATESACAERSQQPVDSTGSGCNIMSRMALNDNKAGMEGLDKDRINQIIYETSKDSKFFENEKKKEQQLELRIREQQIKMSKITRAQLKEAEMEADKTLAMLEDERDLSRTIVHVDMDAFYAAVEMRDEPTLRDKPMAVGGMGMLSTSNYLARRFGVRAAMPGFIGLKLCPSLVIVKPNFEKYHAVSKEVRNVLSQYDPNFCPMSLDEAYLDLTNHLQQRQHSSPLSRMFLLRQETAELDENLDGKENWCMCDLNSVLRPDLICHSEFQDHSLSDDSLRTFLNSLTSAPHPAVCNVCHKMFPKYTCKIYGQNVEDAVLELRNRIQQRTHLTASAGIAPNTMLAKVCSDKNKPNGQYRIKPDKMELIAFIRDLPIRKISGIGKVTEKLLGSLGVVACKDLYTHRAMLYHLFSPISFHHFMRISAGVSSTSVERDGERKSISTERTFSEVSNPKQLFEKCQELCQSLSEDMKEEKVLGKTLTLKIKTVGFEVKTRSYTLSHLTNEETTLMKAAQILLQSEIDAAHPSLLRLRLMGVRMSKLCAEEESQVSVIDMFKKMSSKDFGTQGTKDFPSASSSDSLNKMPHHTLSEGSLYLNEHFGSEGEDSDDDESVEFHLPLEQTLALEVRNFEVNDHKVWSKQDKQLIPNKSKRESSTSDNVGMLKFVNKLPKGSDALVHAISEEPKSEVVSQPEADVPETSYSSSFAVQQVPLGIGDISSCNSYEIYQTGEPKQEKPEFKDNGFYVAHKKSAHVMPDPAQVIVSEETRMVSCPICKQQKLNWPLEQLNTHIDLCLNKQIVKDLLHKEKMGRPATASTSYTREKAFKRSVATDELKPKDKKAKIQPSVISYFKS
ncbi:DNA polymerase kappa-like [Plakobranchus ocellatus]|uniref:DNA polymerase kappa n=1 Tax=Plakobranchus ocellatus TaxID=259542 RepID=A0AAV4DR14_9GAST|nr:DNA polymerase kappa-like [Plakobranchus ocellatus]